MLILGIPLPEKSQKECGPIDIKDYISLLALNLDMVSFISVKGQVISLLRKYF